MHNYNPNTTVKFSHFRNLTSKPLKREPFFLSLSLEAGECGDRKHAHSSPSSTETPSSAIPHPHPRKAIFTKLPCRQPRGNNNRPAPRPWREIIPTTRPGIHPVWSQESPISSVNCILARANMSPLRQRQRRISLPPLRLLEH